MNIEKLQNSDKLYLSGKDISRILSISLKSAQVTASRYVKEKRLVRLKRDIYIIPEKLKTISEEELFFISNLLQTPSYISLTTALSYYNLSTQQTPSFIEAIGLKRTISFGINDIEFNFIKIQKAFYFGFERNDNFFIASPIKALADSIYLTAIGKYNCDFDAIELEKFDKTELSNLLNSTNKATQNLWLKLIRNYKL
ncbi:MAG: hypothetical protein Q8N03_13845 [Ignavibacteria bacterium]|nr:hypothetical protein [Ignavibacteria bacterium]